MVDLRATLNGQKLTGWGLGMAERRSEQNKLSFNKKSGVRAGFPPGIPFQPPDTPQLGTGAPGTKKLMSFIAEQYSIV